jgi:hypothetical protein
MSIVRNGCITAALFIATLLFVHTNVANAEPDIEKDATIARKLGRIITMGLWQKRGDHYYAAYNTMMDENATIKLIRLVNQHRIPLVNFPSHAIWQISSLDGGHVSAT